jgi:glutamate-1-semialdehyde 2,1-aminomutase
MHFTGAGSMLSPHFRPGPITAPYKASVEEEQMRELFFFDMLAAGMYLARRGMVALMLPVTDADCARFVAAVEEFCAARKPVLAAA